MTIINLYDPAELAWTDCESQIQNRKSKI